mgnify:CR=1 FL=1
MEDYLVPGGQAQAEYIEKKSRFIGQVFPITTEQEAKATIERVRRQHYDARHNCWCYILKSGQKRYSDDGEPQGTAGQPMLNVFERERVVDVLCVVTRYFGGVKLGAGGLARAYAKAAADGANAAKIVKYVLCVFAETAADYEQYAKILKFAESKKYKVVDTRFSESADVRFAVPEERFSSFGKDLADFFGGKLQAKTSGRGYCAFEE